jgi:pyridoxal phosphate enzyme (YggS family)
MQGLEKLSLRLEKACETAGRDVSEVSVLAVGKKHPSLLIRRLFEQGQRNFGENLLQEAMQKQQELADLDIIWHYIGHVQSNKTKQLAEHFDWVQSVDRLKILRRLSEQRPASMQPLNICLQVNIDREPQKSGLLPEEVPEFAKMALDMPNLACRGLMAIPRPSPDPAVVSGSFLRVRAIYDDLCALGCGFDTLSMGMSSDLEEAVAQGSTMVRIGTDLFGPRPEKTV